MVRVSVAEKREIARAAKRAGMGVSTWLRMLARRETHLKEVGE